MEKKDKEKITPLPPLPKIKEEEYIEPLPGITEEDIKIFKKIMEDKEKFIKKQKGKIPLPPGVKIEKKYRKIFYILGK